MTSDIDTTQFNDTPVIRKLAETNEKKSRKRTKSSDDTSTRGRKKKYNTDEERLEARRLQQRQYRERKRAELAALKQNHSLTRIKSEKYIFVVQLVQDIN